MTEKSEDLFDVRVLEHRLRRGVITEADYEAWLETLPDVADDAVETTTRFAPVAASPPEEGADSE